MAARFSGLPQTTWLTEAGGDRRMELLGDFWFRDRADKEWRAPQGSRIDGASIPQPLWSTVGSPYTGSYRRASIVHDVACERAGTSDERRAADKMFFEACRAGGCDIAQATLLYTGVRMGAHWTASPFWLAADKGLSPEPKLRRSLADKKLQADFEVAATHVLEQGETDDPDLLEQRVDQALSLVSGVDLQNR